MHLVEFKEQNVTIAEDQPEYLPLPAFRFPSDPLGRVVCCWKLPLKDRLRVLFTGRIWHQVLTFNASLQPQLLTVEKPELRS